MVTLESRHIDANKSEPSLSLSIPSQASIAYMLERAYQNIYGASMPTDPHYSQDLTHAAEQLVMDHRAKSFTARELLSVMEDMIRVAEEHHKLARQHAAKASNAIYLRETALDKALEDRKYRQALSEILPETNSSPTRVDGRIGSSSPVSSSEMMELAYQQLALRPNH